MLSLWSLPDKAIFVIASWCLMVTGMFASLVSDCSSWDPKVNGIHIFFLNFVSFMGAV